MAATKQKHIRRADVSAADIYKVSIRKVELDKFLPPPSPPLPPPPPHHSFHLWGENERKNNVSVHGRSFSQSNNSTAGRESGGLEARG